MVPHRCVAASLRRCVAASLRRCVAAPLRHVTGTSTVRNNGPIRVGFRLFLLQVVVEGGLKPGVRLRGWLQPGHRPQAYQVLVLRHHEGDHGLHGNLSSLSSIWV